MTVSRFNLVEDARRVNLGRPIPIVRGEEVPMPTWYREAEKRVLELHEAGKGPGSIVGAMINEGTSISRPFVLAVLQSKGKVGDEHRATYRGVTVHSVGSR